MWPKYDLDKIKFATDEPTFEKAVGIYESGGVKDFHDNEMSDFLAKVKGSGGESSEGGASSGTGGETSGQPKQPKFIQAIKYQNKYLPVSELLVEDEVGCGADHWHAARGVAIAADGTEVFDPSPQCGYGKVRDFPVMQVEVQ